MPIGSGASRPTPPMNPAPQPHDARVEPEAGRRLSRSLDTCDYGRRALGPRILYITSEGLPPQGARREQQMLKGFRADVAVYASCFVSAFVLRVSLSTTTLTPDSESYLRMAENVLLHGCYSNSRPDTAECSPTWSNQPPGYPLFIAAVKAVSSGTADAIVLAQCLVYAVAVAYALYSLRQSLHLSRRSLVATGLVLSLSPLTASWSQWVLTETLAAAAALWVGAECLRSLSSGVFRTRPLAAALAVSLMVRWDLIWLVVPVAIVAFRLRARGGTTRRMAIAIGAMGLPVVLMSIRAVLVGLPAMPRYMDAPPDELPPGIYRFWRVTSISQTAASTLLWKVWNRQYGGIATIFDYDSVSNRVDPARLREAIGTLSSTPDGTAVSRKIDDAFAAITSEAVRRNQASYWADVVFRRSLSIWSARDTITWSGWLSDHEAYLRPYRVALLIVVLVAPFAWPRGSTLRMFSAGVVLFVVIRTTFLVTFTAVEIRYVTPFIPIMEVVAVLFVARPRLSLGTAADATVSPQRSGLVIDTGTEARPNGAQG